VGTASWNVPKWGPVSAAAAGPSFFEGDSAHLGGGDETPALVVGVEGHPASAAMPHTARSSVYRQGAIGGIS
jgi:hypothetical protein